jgi:effector-binding domain-containing protein
MKKVLYVIIGLLVIYLILCLVGPKVSHIERTAVIDQKPEVVKEKLLDLKFFNEKWSPWTKKDSKMKVTYSGEVGKEGYKYDWDGNPDSVGSGSMVFTGISGDTIKQKLIFNTWNMTSDIHLIAVPEGEKTKVTWALTMPMGFMWRGMGLFMSAEKMMGKDFDEGIASMKTALESVASAPMFAVKEIEWPETNFIGSKRAMVTMMEMPGFYSKHLPAIGEALGKNKIQPEAAPMGLYWSFDEKEMKGDMAAVFKVAPGAKVKGFENYTFPGGKVLHVEYYGNYEKIGAAHKAIDAYMKEKGLTQDAGVFEEYVTDPMSEKDTMKWLTNIYYRVK